MALLDFDDTYEAPYSPPFVKLDNKEEERMKELNNLGRKKVSEDYSDEIEKLT